MRPTLTALLLVLIGPTAQAQEPGSAGGPAPSAPSGLPAADPGALVARLHRALGGADAPYRARSLAFTFVVERGGQVVARRPHRWSPPSGDHRVELSEKDGPALRVEWNLHARQGRAWRGAEALAGADLAAALDRAWKAWVNDTYWLLMPYKLLDPGVRLAGEPAALVDGRVFDRVRVSFDGVGLTPGDTYWAWFARDTGLMERWSFVLEGQQPPARVFDWTDWRAFGPLLLSTRKTADDGSMQVRFEQVRVE